MSSGNVDFTLAPCGPVDRLQMRMRIMAADAPRAGQRAMVIALAAWLPLCILSILYPNPGAHISFLRDIATHTRFLLVMPLLIIAENAIGQRSRLVASQFLSSGLVSDADAGRFESAWRRGRALLDAWLPEVIIMLITAAAAWFSIHGMVAEHTGFWFEHETPQGVMLNEAGWWNFTVARPILVFLLLRWVWRYIVWWWFLGRVAKLDLQLTASHPDREGGLGFVTFHHSVFSLITLAVGCLVPAFAAERILAGDATLRAYQTPILAVAALGVIIGVGPMLVFTGKLVMAKRKGLSSYSQLASDYVWMFEQKWMDGKARRDDLLGTGDIQSLADIGGSFERMMHMRVFAIDRRLIMAFVVASVAPALPLLLTIMPLKEIVKVLIKALM